MLPPATAAAPHPKRRSAVRWQRDVAQPVQSGFCGFGGLVQPAQVAKNGGSSKDRRDKNQSSFISAKNKRLNLFNRQKIGNSP
jgi:hypothetical protein